MKMEMRDIEREFKKIQEGMISERIIEIEELKLNSGRRLAIAACLEGIELKWSTDFYLRRWWIVCESISEGRKLASRILLASEIKKFDKAMDILGEWYLEGKDEELKLEILIYPAESSSECEPIVTESISKVWVCRRKEVKA